MLKLVVTANLTTPMALRITAYIVASASGIIVGPETVPPRRNILLSNGSLRTATLSLMQYAVMPTSRAHGSSFAMIALNSSTVIRVIEIAFLRQSAEFGVAAYLTFTLT